MNLLFMCVANSARSQLAEGMAKKILGTSVTIQSAGSKPSHVNPLAVAALKEVGVDAGPQSSKSCDDLSPQFLDRLDYVITLCAEEVCPILITKAKRLHWPLPDPANQPGTAPDTTEEQLDRFRKTREEIARRIKAFAQEKGLSIAG